MQLQFQQFVEFFVPLVQFLDRMVDIPAASRSWYRTVHTVVLEMVLDAPVVVQQQVPWLGSRNAGFDDGHMLCIILGGFWKNSDFLHEGVDSAPELDSRSALLPVTGTLSTTAVACSIPSRCVPMIAGSFQRSAQSMLQLLTKCTWKSVQYFYEPPVSFSVFSVRIFCESIFWSPRALTSVSARGLGGVPESPGVVTPR